MLYPLRWGAVTLYLGRGALARARWLRKNLLPESGKSDADSRFHHENIKVRKNTGTLLLCVKGSVHSEALSANA